MILRLVLAVVLGLGLTGCGEGPDAGDAGGGADGSMDAGPAVSRCAAHSECDDQVFCNGVEECAPGEDGSDARGCRSAAEGPCEEGKTCDEETRQCEVECDADGDGHLSIACAGDDCDDNDPDRYPGNFEICDAHDRDEDCRPATYGFQDLDGDGYVDAACCNVDDEGVRHCGNDCDDMNKLSHPGRTEACDGFDNDCDGEVDEGVLRTFYPDADGDGFGDSTAAPVKACDPPPGHVENNTDCDDDNPAAHNPSAPEICDNADNDCDGIVDEGTTEVAWHRDLDGDLFGDAMDPAPVVSCLPVPGRVPNAGDCDDTVAAVNPSAPEQCNGRDDDCDGDVDEGVQMTYFRDADGDLHGTPDDTALGCTPPAGYVAINDDCDDTRADVYGGRAESCDGVDNDCDGDVDEGVLNTYYLDADGDLHGDPSMPLIACTAPAGYVALGNDCDDSSATTYPGATELCNNIDDNCSSGGGPITSEDQDGDGHSPPGAACVGGFPKDDCNDAHPEIYGGNPNYYGEPIACRVSSGIGFSTWCPDAGCCIRLGTVCSDTSTCDGIADWDYDCNGRDDAAPPATSCRPHPLFPLSCEGGGPIYTGPPPACGHLVASRWCFNVGAGSCRSMTESRPMPCR